MYGYIIIALLISDYLYTKYEYMKIRYVNYNILISINQLNEKLDMIIDKIDADLV